MTKVKLLNRASGVGKESGRPWCRITLGCDHSDGSRSVADFFVSPELATKVTNIALDSSVYVSADLDQHLHYVINDVRSADSSTTTSK